MWLSPYDFFKYCREHYQTPVKTECCQHYRVEFQFIRPCDIRRHQDSNLDEAFPQTHQIYSVRKTAEPLTLKVRHVPCLCPPCITEEGECLNSSHTDDWKVVNLIPKRGANLQKYMKRKRPDAHIICEMEEDDVTSHDPSSEKSYKNDSGTTTNNNSDDDDDAEIESIVFENESEKTVQKNKNQKEIETSKKENRENHVTDTEHVTDTVTDPQGNLLKEVHNQQQCSWINHVEQVSTDDSIICDEPADAEINQELEILDICSRTSKEFALHTERSSTNITTDEIVNADDIMKLETIPEHILWPSILSACEACTDYEQLVQVVQELKEKLPPLKPRNMEVTFSSITDRIDLVAQEEILHDGPRHLKACCTLGDGNCLCQAVSKGMYNTDRHHIEIRARILIEAVLHREKYLSDAYLERGASFTHRNADLPTVFLTFSEYYTPGQKLTDDTITAIYSLELHSCAKLCSYMGLWQLAQASSALQTPIHSIYPVRRECTIRKDFNRMFFPVDYSTTDLGNDKPVVIMWTGVTYGGVPIHFVPLLKANQ